MILKLENTKDYSEIIRLIKYYFSRNIKIFSTLSSSKLKKREKGIWQRRFWEHTIKDEADLYKHLDYIHFNSYKHYKISPCDWTFSTFKKFVGINFYSLNWCNIGDTNGINDLNFE